MRAATEPRAPLAERLLVVDPSAGDYHDSGIAELPAFLSSGDVLVVNDAATLPASFRVSNLDAELRLVARGEVDGDWLALLMGPGDHRTPTEQRPDPPEVCAGDRLALGEELRAEVIGTAEAPFISVRFSLSGARLFAAIYRLGRPIQYSYLREPLSLRDVQNRFAARPWALELPSAGHSLTFGLLSAIRRRGVEIVHLTHAAGISSTGREALDRRLPLPERYDLPERTVSAIESARRRGGRVVAVGTTVVRALESNAAGNGSRLRPGVGVAELVIGPGFRPRVADGVLSGMHPPSTSHFALSSAFADPVLLRRALVHAEDAGYLEHEFGDACLVLSRRV